MKVRLSNRMIRIRLSQKDLETLKENKAVTTVAAFSTVHQLEISLQPSTLSKFDSQFTAMRLLLLVPIELIENRPNEELILRDFIPHQEQPTEIVIEVDLPCMH